MQNLGASRHEPAASLWCRPRTSAHVSRTLHGGSRRSAFPQRSGRAGDRDRRQGIHVRGRDAAFRSSARLPRHGRGQRDHLPLLLDALPPRPGARFAQRRGRRNAHCRSPRPLKPLPERKPMAPPRHVIVAGAGHCRADGGAGDGARRLARHRAGAGGEARRDRRRHPAFAQRHARADRARLARTADSLCRDAASAPRDGRRLGPRDRAHPARKDAERRYGAPYLDDPPRRPAGGAGRRGARQARHLAQARRPRRGLRRPRQRRHRARPPRPARWSTSAASR